MPTVTFPLALAAGELIGAAVEEALGLKDPGSLVDPALDLVPRGAAVAQPVRHVVEHAHVRVEA